MEIEVYSTVVGDLVKMVEQKKPMCFIPYSQWLEYKAEMEQKVEELQFRIDCLEK